MFQEELERVKRKRQTPRSLSLNGLSGEISVQTLDALIDNLVNLCCGSVCLTRAGVCKLQCMG